MNRLRFRCLRYLLLCVFLWNAGLAFPATLSPFAQAVPELDTTTSDTLIAVHYAQSSGGLPAAGWEDPGIRVVFALWQSGHMVWTKDPRRGGPPYDEVEIAPEKFETALKAIDAKAAELAIPAKSSWHALALDRFEAFFLLRGYEAACVMETSFEIYESLGKDPRVQLASGRVERLEGKSREEVLQNEPLEYRQFREFWLFAKKTLLDLIPKEGVHENDDLRFREWTTVEWKPLGKPDR